MPKSLMDWLGVVSLWVGAIVLAFKSTDAPLMRGAPMIFAAEFWNYVPLVLVSLALSIFIYRQFRPVVATARSLASDPTPSPLPSPAPPPPPQPRSRSTDSLVELKKARDSAAIAVKQGTMRTRLKALHEVEAAMVTINKEFGIPSPHLDLAKDDSNTRLSLEIWVRHIDCFYALLRAEHVEEARAKAAMSAAQYTLPDEP